MLLNKSFDSSSLSLVNFFRLGLQIDTKIGAVVMGFDLHLNYFKIAYAAALLNHNPKAHLIFTNADSQFPTDKWILPGNGKTFESPPQPCS